MRNVNKYEHLTAALHRAAVSALFSLVVQLITYCVVKSHFILLFEQIKKERKKEKWSFCLILSREIFYVTIALCLNIL